MFHIFRVLCLFFKLIFIVYNFCFPVWNIWMNMKHKFFTVAETVSVRICLYPWYPWAWNRPMGYESYSFVLHGANIFVYRYHFICYSVWNLFLTLVLFKIRLSSIISYVGFDRDMPSVWVWNATWSKDQWVNRLSKSRVVISFLACFAYSVITAYLHTNCW